MHILFLTDNFPPEVNAPASRTFEHSREWMRTGHRVTVITCAPNFPKGEVFNGYRNKLWQSEEMEGIRVIRVWSYITANEGFIKRIADYLSYMFSAILAAPFVRGVDQVVGTSPQFFTACAAFVVSRYKRVPFIFELRDLWPESIRAVGAMDDSAMLRQLERLELFLYRKAALIISVTNPFKRNLVSRGIDASKIEVVTNGVDLSRFRPRPKDIELQQQLGLEGKFVAGYVGTHGMAHNLTTLLDAAGLLLKHQDGSNIRLIFLGHGAAKESLMKKTKTMELSNVIFLDSVPKDQVPRYWSLLDISIIHLKKTDLFKTVIPSKLFECMGMGVPVLHGVAGESAEIVEKEGVGLVFEPENAESLCKMLLSISKDEGLQQKLRSRCLKAAKHYDRNLQAQKMLGFLEKIVKR